MCLSSHLKRHLFAPAAFASLAHMRERRYGRIIKLFLECRVGQSGSAQFMRQLKQESWVLLSARLRACACYGITCNAIFPVAATRMTDTIHQEAFRITPSGEAQEHTVPIRPMSRRSLFFSPATMRPR